MRKLSILVFLFFLMSSIPSLAQSPGELKADKLLQAEIMKMDSLLFDVAFNKCDLSLFKQIVRDGFEFYDDRSGLNTSLNNEINSFKDRCSKPYSVTRKLVASEVHVLGDYGAVQTGEHEFYVDDEKVEKAKFTTIWQYNGDEALWIMRRAISYDHQAITSKD